MAITTSNSTRVNPRLERVVTISHLHEKDKENDGAATIAATNELKMK
jgi:hypothetical protein